MLKSRVRTPLVSPFFNSKGEYMQISLRDLYILLECGKHCLRIANPSISISRENIEFTVNRLINQLDDVKLEIKED